MMDDKPAIHQPSDAQLISGEVTIDYMALQMALWLVNSTRPWFTLLQMRAMLLDQQVWFGLQLRNAPLIQAQVQVKGRSTEINQFVQEQWDRFWLRFAPKILATKYFGYAGFEVMYSDKSGLIEIDGLKDFSPTDVRPLRQANGPQSGRIAGVGVYGHRQDISGNALKKMPIRLFGMKGLWLNFNPMYGSAYGEPATLKAYPAWWDKAMPGGAYDLRRLRCVKDAWRGDMIKYPANYQMVRPDGTKISGRDIAREFVELIASGGVGVLPSDRDPATGQPLFEYQPPAEVADTSVIRNWIEDSDWDIFDGLLVPREVVEAASSGSGFSGRSIPFVMFLAMGDVEFLNYVLAWKHQIAEPLVCRNFGDAANDFDMEPVPLLDVMAEKMGGQSMGGQSMGGQSMGGPVGGASGGAPAQSQPQPQAIPFQPRVAQQFATVDDPPGTRKKRTAANRGLDDALETSGLVRNRLAALLKKNAPAHS